MELLAGADAFVLPCVWASGSMVDGIPVAAMEAMAAEVPVVSTAISGIPELIADGISGLLVEPENPQALAHAIQTLMDDTELRERLAAAGRERVAEESEIAQNVSKLRALLGNV